MSDISDRIFLTISYTLENDSSSIFTLNIKNDLSIASCLVDTNVIFNNFTQSIITTFFDFILWNRYHSVIKNTIIYLVSCLLFCLPIDSINSDYKNRISTFFIVKLLASVLNLAQESLHVVEQAVKS